MEFRLLVDLMDLEKSMVRDANNTRMVAVVFLMKASRSGSNASSGTPVYFQFDIQFGIRQ
jgi:hypothetical protein